MQLKGIIKNMATKTGIKANALLQNYMLERLLERISVSEYKWKFILKGGMLISAIVV
jgi:predicted nucleotidyltransferase component of viral defense system